MKRYFILTAAICGLVAAMPLGAHAAGCAAGVYRAGCAGPNGAVVVRKHPYYRAPAPYYHPPATYYRPPGAVHCANGVYRAGCAGPNGAAVVRKPY
jgi:hypothetical protein